MRTVFKYLLTPLDVQWFNPTPEVKLPVDAKIVTIDVQHDQLCLWAEVDPDPDVATEAHRFAIVGTGHPIPTDACHLHTFQMANGALIFHLYEHR